MRIEEYQKILAERREAKKVVVAHALEEELNQHRAGRRSALSNDFSLSRVLRMSVETLRQLKMEVLSPDDLDYRDHILKNPEMSFRGYLKHKQEELLEIQRRQELVDLAKCSCDWTSVDCYSELTPSEIQLAEKERPGIRWQTLLPSFPEILFMRALIQRDMYSSCQVEAEPGQIYYPGFGLRNIWFKRIDDGRRYKIPDFKVKGQEKVIEIFGDYYHSSNLPSSRYDYDFVPELQIRKFAEVGVSCRVYWERDVTNPNQLSRIISDVRDWILQQ